MSNPPIQITVVNSEYSEIYGRQPGRAFVSFNFDNGWEVQTRFDEETSRVIVWTLRQGESISVSTFETMGADALADHLFNVSHRKTIKK